MKCRFFFIILLLVYYESHASHADELPLEQADQSLVAFKILGSSGSAIQRVDGLICQVYYGDKSLQGKRVTFYIGSGILIKNKSRNLICVVKKGENGAVFVREVWLKSRNRKGAATESGT